MDSNDKIPFAMWRAAILIGFQGFLCGYFFNALNGCIITGDNGSGSDCYHDVDDTCPPGTVYNDLNLSNVEVQIATSLIVAGGWLGCMIGSYPAEKFGRKTTIIGNNLFFITGAALTAIGNLPCLLIGRFIAGVGVGMATVAPPVLLAELASDKSRGTITTVFPIQYAVGIFVASMMSYIFVYYVDHGWQYVQALAAIPALLTILCQAFIYESPKWLLAHNSPEIIRDKVVSILQLVRPRGYEVSDEIQAITTEVKNNSQTEVSWAEVFTYRKAIIIGGGLTFFWAVTGINSVVFYSSTIFDLAGFEPSVVGTVLWTILNVFMSFVTQKLIDQAGRKTLLMSGQLAMLVALLVLSVVLLSPISDQVQGIIAVLAVLVFVGGYAVGIGAVCWTIISEIVPTRIRSKSFSLFLSINWVMNLVIGLLTLTAINGIGGASDDMDDDSEREDRKKTGVGALYLVFAGMNALCVAFIYFLVPETKGKSHEDLLDSDTPLLTER